MRAGFQQDMRFRRRKERAFPPPVSVRRLWPILVALAVLSGAAGGQIFAQSGFVPFSNSIIGLDVSPDDASVVLAGTLNVPVPAGIYRSTDGGHTWSRADVELPADTSVASIRFDPQDGNRVLAADGGVGNLFISEDGGQSWRQESSINQVLTPNSGIGRLFARVEDGVTVFYAGTRYDGVVRSSDGGLSWAWYGEGLTGSALRVRAFGDKDGALYAGTHDGVWRLTRDAGHWERVDLPAGIIARGMTILDSRLYVGTFASGLYLSDDGYNWVQDPSFPAGVVIYDVTVSGQKVIVGTNVGLWTQSVPDWTRVTVNGAVFTNPVFRLASSSTFFGVTYAGTEQDGVLRTLDSGDSFLSSAQITPLNPAELSRVPTPTPPPSDTSTPTATPDLGAPTETPTSTATASATPDPNLPTATPTATDAATATPDPDAPTATPTAECLPVALHHPMDTPTATSTVTATPDPNAPTGTPTATGTLTATPEPNMPADMPPVECTPVPAPDADVPADQPSTDAPDSTPASSTAVPETPPPLPPSDGTATSTPTPSEGVEQPTATATTTTVGPGNVNERLAQIPPIWIGGAAVFFLLIVFAGISVARDGGSGTEEL
ncbi:MAG: hypothetical protein F4Z82_10480 [Caldilineaceae bacterium SB0668_bin_21]|nr:hypothetical protein [Caldilineaceae bacterium SB0668_bin_21]MYC21705.1 hypothetical protein [Caldilineaceae bacterium SB0662_bin_25]